MAVFDLPLGVDLGSQRVRVARVQSTPSGDARLCAIAARDLPANATLEYGYREPDLISAVVAELRLETGARRPHCVAAVDARAASLSFAAFPRMPRHELRRAARFEAERTAPANVTSAPNLVRVCRADAAGEYAIGVVRSDALRERTACLRRAGLRPIALDYDACALRRAFPRCDAVIDAGHEAVRLHVYRAAGVTSCSVDGGGSGLTRAIAADLSIEPSAAERRKRSIGLAGAGGSAVNELVAGLYDAVARARERGPIRHIVLVGNAARLADLPAILRDRLDASVEIGASALLFGGTYPADVVRAGAPDWTLAAALACWNRTP